MPARTPADVHRQFAQAMNAGDLKALAELYPAHSGPGAHKGREAIEDLLALKPRISVETRSVVRSGAVALLGSRWRLAGTTPEGRAIALSGQGAEVVRRQADGSWHKEQRQAAREAQEAREAARNKAAEELINAGPVTLARSGSRDTDRYGRKLRVIRRSGRSLGGILVAERLARRWNGRRRSWCG